MSFLHRKMHGTRTMQVSVYRRMHAIQTVQAPFFAISKDLVTLIDYFRGAQMSFLYIKMNGTHTMTRFLSIV